MPVITKILDEKIRERTGTNGDDDIKLLLDEIVKKKDETEDSLTESPEQQEPRIKPLQQSTVDTKGLIAKGNIDLAAQPSVDNPETGGKSTVYSIGVNIDGKEVLLPKVTPDGRFLSNDEAVAEYKKTGKHLGIFDTPESASAYADQLHKDYESGKIKPLTPAGMLLRKPESKPGTIQSFADKYYTPQSQKEYTSDELNKISKQLQYQTLKLKGMEPELPAEQFKNEWEVDQEVVGLVNKHFPGNKNADVIARELWVAKSSNPDFFAMFVDKSNKDAVAEKELFAIEQAALTNRLGTLANDAEILEKRGEADKSKEKATQYISAFEDYKNSAKKYPDVIAAELKQKSADQLNVPLPYPYGGQVEQIWDGLNRVRNIPPSFVEGILRASKTLGESAAELAGADINNYSVVDRAYDSAAEALEAATVPVKSMPLTNEDGSLNPEMIAPHVIEQVGIMAALMAGGSVTTQSMIKAGINPKAAQFAGLTTSGYILSIDEYHKKAQELGMNETEANRFANRSAFVQGALESVNPNLRFAFGSKPIMQGAAQLVKDGVAPTTKQIAKAYFTNIGKENAQEIMQLAGDKMNEYVANATLGENYFNPSPTMNELKETVLLTTLVTGLVGAGEFKIDGQKAEAAKYTLANMMKANPTEISNVIEAQVANGTITPQQAITLRADVEGYAKALAKMPSRLTDEQKMQAAPLIQQKDALEEQKEKVDEVFHQSIDDEIKQLGLKLREQVGLPLAPKAEEKGETTFFSDIPEEKSRVKKVKEGEVSGITSEIPEEKPSPTVPEPPAEKSRVEKIREGESSGVTFDQTQITTDAIPQQEPDESVLRTEAPQPEQQMGLQEMGTAHPESESVTEEGALEEVAEDKSLSDLLDELGGDISSPKTETDGEDQKVESQSSLDQAEGQKEEVLTSPAEQGGAMTVPPASAVAETGKQDIAALEQATPKEKAAVFSNRFGFVTEKSGQQFYEENKPDPSKVENPRKYSDFVDKVGDQVTHPYHTGFGKESRRLNEDSLSGTIVAFSGNGKYAFIKNNSGEIKAVSNWENTREEAEKKQVAADAVDDVRSREFAKAAGLRGGEGVFQTGDEFALVKTLPAGVSGKRILNIMNRRMELGDSRHDALGTAVSIEKFLYYDPGFQDLRNAVKSDDKGVRDGAIATVKWYNESGVDVPADVLQGAGIVKESAQPAGEAPKAETSFEERTDTEHAAYIKDKFVKEFTDKGVPKEQVEAAVALMEARAKASGLGDAWYRRIGDIGSGEFQSGTKRLMQEAPFQTRDGEPIGFNYDTDKVARERFDFSNLRKIGSGSDRDVYDLGDGKVLKVAKTARGLEQNIYEGDFFLSDNGITPQAFERGLNYVVVENVIPAISKTYNVGNVLTVDVANEKAVNKKLNDMLRELRKFTSTDFDNHNHHLLDALDKYGLSAVANYDLLWDDFIAKRNWGIKDGNPIHLDGGTFGGVDRILTAYRGVKNLSDPEFADIYYESRALKKKFGDTDRNTRYQDKKGAVETLANGRKIIHALDAPDFSTVVHELAHVFEDELSGADRQTVQDWAKTKKWNESTSEAFARGFERYLRDGNAPSDDLKSIFQRAKEWLTSIYQSLKGSPISKKVSPEVKQIFDNLLAEPSATKEITPADIKIRKAKGDRGDFDGEQDVIYNGVVIGTMSFDKGHTNQWLDANYKTKPGDSVFAGGIGFNKEEAVQYFIDRYNERISGEKTPKFAEDENAKPITESVPPPKTEGGLGSELQQAASITRGVQKTGEEAERGFTQKVDSDDLEKHAKDNGLWVDDYKSVYGDTPITKESESEIYLDKDGKSVIKINNGTQHSSWEDFFNRITAHNTYFPQAKYDIVGYTNRDGKLAVILKQPFIKSERGATREEVIADLKSRGFEVTGINNARDKENGVILRDLHSENAIINEAGNVVYIDPLIQFEKDSKFLSGIQTEGVAKEQVTAPSIENVFDFIESKGFERDETADNVRYKREGVTLEIVPFKLNKFNKGSESLSKGEKGFTLNLIAVDKAKRGKGVASKVLKELTDYADQNGETVYLSANNSVIGFKQGLSNKQLEDWYARHGFEKDENIMVRKPQPSAEKTAPKVTAPSLEEKENASDLPLTGAEVEYGKEGARNEVPEVSKKKEKFTVNNADGESVEIDGFKVTIPHYEDLEAAVYKNDSGSYQIIEKRTGALLGGGTYKTAKDAAQSVYDTLLWQQSFNKEYQSIYEMVDDNIERRGLKAEKYNIAKKFIPHPNDKIAILEERIKKEREDIEEEHKKATRYLSSPNTEFNYQTIERVENRIAEIKSEKETPQPPAEKQLYKIGKSPQTYEIVEELPFDPNTDLEGEKAVRVRNTKTGDEQTVLQTDLKPVKKRESNKEVADKVRKAKINTKGKAFDATIGLPIAIWNGAVETVAKAIEAGVATAEAIKRGLNYIQKNHRGQWNKKAYNDKIIEELGLRGIEVNGEELVVQPMNDVETAKTINGFYQPLERAIANSNITKATGKEWAKKLSAIEGEEMKWTGMADFLKQSESAQLTKQQLSDYMRDNRIEIVEVVKGDFFDESKFKKVETRQADRDDRIGFTDTWVSPNGMEISRREYPEGGEKFEVAYKQGGLGIRAFPSFGEAVKWVRENSVTEESAAKQEGTATKFGQYQLPGEKSNYKEVLITLPRIGSYDAELKRLAEKYNVERNYVALRQSKATDSELENLRGLQKAPNFKSTHFDEPNILAHLRMNTRTDTEGSKVLFIEEIQSDWGQKGKREGFKISEQEQKARNYYPTDGIPQAPFVTETPSWTKLALKYALRHAVQQGASKLSWTTGEQQNERYDLSKQVDLITVGQQKNGDKYISIDLKGTAGESILYYDDTGKITENDGNTIPNTIGRNLSDVIGKEITDKILKAQKGDEFKGEDLKVGGKGMVGFYGSPAQNKEGIVGSVAKALVKELAGKEGKLGKVNVSQDAEQWEVVVDGKVVKKFPTEKAAARYIDREMEYDESVKLYDEDGEPFDVYSRATGEYTDESAQHSIEITPELKQSVEKGLPLFKEPSRSFEKRIDDAILNIQDFIDSGAGKGNVQGILPTINEFEARVLLAGFKAVKAGIQAKKTIEKAIADAIATIKKSKYYNDNISNIDIDKVEQTLREQAFESDKPRVRFAGTKTEVTTEPEVTEETGEEAEEPETRKRRQHSEKIEARPEITIEQTERGKWYEPITNASTVEQADQAIMKNGLEGSFADVINTKNDIPNPVRAMMGMRLLRLFELAAAKAENKEEETKLRNRAIETAEFMTAFFTETAQTLQAASVFSVLSPTTAIMAFEKSIKKIRNKKITDNKEEFGDKRDAMRDANEEAINEVLDQDSVKGKIDKAKKKSKTNYEDRLKKIREKRENIRKRYRQNGGNLLQANGLSPAGIRFATELIASHIEEGIVRLEEIVDRVIEDLKALAGQDIPIEAREQVSAKTRELLDKQAEKFATEGLRQMEVNLEELVKGYYTEEKRTKESLADRIVANTSLTGEEAEILARDIQNAFDRIAIKKKQQALDRLITPRERVNKRKTKERHEKLIEFSNIGGFSDHQFNEKYADILEFPKLTDGQRAEVQRLAERVQKFPEGSFWRFRATEDMLKYQQKVKGVDWGDVLTSVWYASILSGYKTQALNAVANMYNTMGELTVATIYNPKAFPYLIHGLWNGMWRGMLEGYSVMRTGYSPIRGKFQIPGVLETHTFKGGWFNPVNYAKFVHRFMTAVDVFFYEGLKEMRAWEKARQLAVQQEGKSEKSINEQVDNMLFHTSEHLHEYIEQAKAEGAKGQEVSKRAWELMEQHRAPELQEDSKNFAQRGTFNHETEGWLGVMADKIAQASEAVRPLKMIVPFTRIITNVANTALDWSPYGFIRAAKGGVGSPRYRDLFHSENKYRKYTREERAKETIKAGMATTIMTALYALAADGGDDDEDKFLDITANGTGDYKKNYTLTNGIGWKEKSIRVGDKWISYANTPLAIPLYIIGKMRDQEKYDIEEDKLFIKKLEIALVSAYGLLTDMTFLNSMSDFTQKIDPTNEEKTAEGIGEFLTRTAKGLVVPSFLNQTFQSIESMMGSNAKQTDGFWQSMVKDVPIARNSLNDKVNALGDPIPVRSKQFTSDVINDPTWEFIIDNKAWIGTLDSKSTTILDPKTKTTRIVTDDEYYKISKRRGELIRLQIEKELMPKAGKMTPEEIRDYINHQIKPKATKIAKAELTKIGAAGE